MNVYLVRQWQSSTRDDCMEDCYWGRTIYVFASLKEACDCVATLNRLYAQGVELDEDDLFKGFTDGWELDYHFYDVEEIELIGVWRETEIYKDFYGGKK